MPFGDAPPVLLFDPCIYKGLILARFFCMHVIFSAVAKKLRVSLCSVRHLGHCPLKSTYIPSPEINRAPPTSITDALHLLHSVIIEGACHYTCISLRSFDGCRSSSRVRVIINIIACHYVIPEGYGYYQGLLVRMCRSFQPWRMQRALLCSQGLRGFRDGHFLGSVDM